MSGDTDASSRVAGSHDAAYDSGFLRMLGDRVREARASRGMTRKILARDSGVSERYLAQLESGQGNVSILLLRDITKALDIPLEVLLLDGPEPPLDLVHTTEFLRRLRQQLRLRLDPVLVIGFERFFGLLSIAVFPCHLGIESGVFQRDGGLGGQEFEHCQPGRGERAPEDPLPGRGDGRRGGQHR